MRQDYVVPVHKGTIGVRRFADGEWWAGMYGFAARDGDEKGRDLGSFVHTVTKHRINASATLVDVGRKKEALEWKTPAELATLPMPAPHRKILDRALAAIQESGSNPTGTAKVPSSAKK